MSSYRAAASLLLLVVACDSSQSGPDDPPLGAPIALAGVSMLEWSSDGSSIYYQRQGAIRSVDVESGSSRDIMNDGCVSLAWAESVAGLAYTSDCAGEQTTLYLTKDGHASTLDSPVAGLIRSADRTLVAYSVPEVGGLGFNDSLVLLNLETRSRNAIASEGALPAFFSPDGSLVLATTPSDQYVILGFDGVTRIELPFSNVHQSDMVIGWDNSGIWYLEGNQATLTVYDPDDGSSSVYHSDPGGVVSFQYTGGTLLPSGGGAVLWDWRCGSSRADGCSREDLAIRYWNPVANEIPRVILQAYDPLGRPPGYDAYDFQAAGSPDGSKLAYVMRGEIRILELR